MVRVYRKKTGSRTGRKDKSGTILLQFFDIGPEHIRVSIKQGVMSSTAPSPALPSPIPMPTTIHDDEPGNTKLTIIISIFGLCRMKRHNRP